MMKLLSLLGGAEEQGVFELPYIIKQRVFKFKNP